MVLYWCGSCIIIDMRSEKGKTGMRGSATQVPEVEIPGGGQANIRNPNKELDMLVVLLHKYEMQQLQLQEMSDELQEMVHLDPLTKLYNRRFLTEHLDEKITRGDNEFAVALLDIIDRESKTVSGVRTDEGTDRCHCGVFSPKLMEAFRAVRR